MSVSGQNSIIMKVELSGVQKTLGSFSKYAQATEGKTPQEMLMAHHMHRHIL